MGTPDNSCGNCDYPQTEYSLPSGVTLPEDWEPCVINMLRAFTGDLGTPPEFSDERLYLVLKAAFFYVQSDLAACPVVDRPAVDPCGDLTESPLEYPPFLNLSVLKAACIIDQGKARAKAALEGVRATCGPATLQVTQASNAFRALFEWGPCAAYKELKLELCFKQPLVSSACCAQIMGPFVSWDMPDGCNNCI